MNLKVLIATMLTMEERKIFNAIYGQSGGPTSVINASAYGLIKEAKKHPDKIGKIFAMHYGIEGLLNEDIIDVSSFKEKELKALLTTPGAAFGSNRYKLNDEISDKAKFDKIIEIFNKYNIHYFFYNGGNDSMETILKISRYAKKVNYELYAIGIPKTIDNDLEILDHTPGYPSAAKYIANSVSSIYFDDASYKKGRVNIVEIMGRDTGWLTASSKLAELNGAKVDLIYVPEVSFDLKSFLKKVKTIYENKGHCLVCVSEGIRDHNSKLIGVMQEMKDTFGHTQLGGVSVFLSSLISKELGYKTRYIELSLLQRANSIIPSRVDIKEAIKCGSFALKSALVGKSQKIVTINRTSSANYKAKYSLTPISKVANKVRYLPLTYLNETEDNINESFISYLLPLIETKKEKALFNSFIIK